MTSKIAAIMNETIHLKEAGHMAGVCGGRNVHQTTVFVEDVTCDTCLVMAARARAS